MLKVDSYSLPNVLAGERAGAGADAARLHAGKTGRRGAAPVARSVTAAGAGNRASANCICSCAAMPPRGRPTRSPNAGGVRRHAARSLRIAHSCHDVARRSQRTRSPPLRIAGVDEAGRGPLAGPVVVAAVVFAPGRTPVNGLDDSKQLTAARREVLYDRIVERALAWHIVFVEVEEIDRINIFQATMLGMRRALEGVRARLPTSRASTATPAARPALPGRSVDRRRRARPLDHGRLDPGQGRARPLHACNCMRSGRSTASTSTRATRTPAHLAALTATRPVPAAPAQLRAGAAESGRPVQRSQHC